MSKAFASSIAALVVALATASPASAVTVSPGGSFTASGEARFRLSGGVFFEGICDVSMAGTLDPSNGSFTITSATFATPCGQIAVDRPVAADIGLPWSGPAKSVNSSGALALPVYLTATLSQMGGDGPLWGVNCDTPREMALSWKNNGTPGAPASRLTTNGYRWFGQSSQTGATCEVLFDLYITPFQTFN